jgi:hypothetical protein
MLLVCAALWLGCGAPAARGHGIPVNIGVEQGRLTVTSGTSDDVGFAPIYLADGSVDAQPESLTLPAFGDILLYNLPGIVINNMTPGSGLFLDALARPVASGAASERRLLWFWNPSSANVSIAPHGESIHILNGFGTSIQLPQAATTLPPPIKVAEPLAGDLGQHKHLLGYAIDNAPPAAAGAYGFFAQFSSPAYQPSRPLLVVLNNGLSPSQLATAATAINGRAFLPGDYNHDDMVNAADHTVWKQKLGALGERYSPGDGNGNGAVDAADYTIWRNNSGAALAVPAAGQISVPEPKGWRIVLIAGVAIMVAWPRSARPCCCANRR